MDHRKTVAWLFTTVLVPFAPVGISAYFRYLKAAAQPALAVASSTSLWWCSEVPFFIIVTCAGIFLRCQEIQAGTVGSWAQKALPWLQAVTGLLGLFSFVTMSLYYFDTQMIPLADPVRKMINIQQCVLAAISLVLSISFFVFERSLDKPQVKNE